MTRPAHIKPIADGQQRQQRAARMLGDELLAKLVAHGSHNAFAALCERHSRALHRYCLSILRNEHDAQDALQSTMTRAYAALRAHERDVSPRAWLFRIAHNESITILRKRSRGPDESQPARAHASDPHVVLEERSRLSQLVADLQALPERQRATLIMRELGGLQMREIAHALDISTAAAKQALFEARNSLRDIDRGRSMGCEEVRSAISLHDRRILRGRGISAHLRACESCRGYRRAITVREADLRTLAPVLPAPALAAALARVLSVARRSGAGALGATNGPSQELVAHAGVSALLKLGAGLAVIAAGAAGAVHAIAKHAPPTRPSGSLVRVDAHPWRGESHSGVAVLPHTTLTGRRAARRQAPRPWKAEPSSPTASHRGTAAAAVPVVSAVPARPHPATAGQIDAQAVQRPTASSTDRQPTGQPAGEKRPSEHNTGPSQGEHGPTFGEHGPPFGGGEGRGATEQGGQPSPKQASGSSREASDEQGESGYESGHGQGGDSNRREQPAG